MKTTINAIPAMTIEEFAEEHDLEMEVNERPHEVGHPSRFYAHFKECELKGDGVLIGTFGNGATPKEAIQDYARKISLRCIVFNAWRETRYELMVPRLVTDGD